jgi:hypothetical protein
MLTIWFHGNGKFKYSRELLEFQITRLAEWTPAAEYLYKNNCILSIHGHCFASRDQIDEGFDNDTKVAYNPRGNMQSKQYQKTHLARCLMRKAMATPILKSMRQEIIRKSPSYWSKTMQ